ncbi:MAG: imidazoleglycerol-phosphate dehydratase HisB [Clostridia bacterium]|nr:imidazoleglycerol-phosphate dehydratase HisB [Clostridia bacterium]
MSGRIGTYARKSRETDISVAVCLEGSGKTELNTGIGFFDHMLDAFARFAQFDLTVRCQGDLQVDAHHSVEDTGICLGEALRDALGDRKGIQRAGSAYLPMDEALAFCALDISGRPYLVFDADFASDRCGTMDTQLCEEFFRAVAVHSGLTLHLRLMYGKNDHHKMEALFKAFGLALRNAARRDAQITGVLSTKGILD